MPTVGYLVCSLKGRDCTALKESFIKHSKHGELYVFDNDLIPEKYCTTTRYNMAYDLAKKENHDYYMFMATDNEFTESLEPELLYGIQEIQNKTGDARCMVFPNDGLHNGALATHPLMAKEWIECLGYFLPINSMNHCFCDNFLTDLGKAVKRIGYAYNAKLIHHNYFKDGTPMDEWQRKAYSKEFYEEDKRRYEYLLKTQLQDDINKLLR